MKHNKLEVEEKLLKGRGLIIQYLISSIGRITIALIILNILIATEIISSVAQLNLEIKLNQKEYFEAFANYILTSSSEWFLPLYSTLGIWGFITVVTQMLCLLIFFRLVNAIDSLFKSRGVFNFFKLARFLLLLSFFMLLVFALFTKTFIDLNPIAKEALDRAVAMQKSRYFSECNENNLESRKQCQRIVESILAAKK